MKPKVDYWALDPDAVAGARQGQHGDRQAAQFFIEGFPDRQMLGWGQRAMGLDQVPTNFDGAGIKIAIIDSGAAQVTHRNLHKVGPGFDVVGEQQDRLDQRHGRPWLALRRHHRRRTRPRRGIRGFAPAAKPRAADLPGARFSDLIGALDYCIENGIDVVNMSLGGGEPSQIVEERLIKSQAMGVACIVAAGNSGGPVQFPASTVHALAVAAIGKSGEFPDDSFHATQALQGFESRGGLLPGEVQLLRARDRRLRPRGRHRLVPPPDGFGAWDGTSMATPHVTGMAALVLAHHPDFKGQFQARNANRVERLFQIIKESATPMPIADATRVGVGLPNVARALGLQAGQDPRTASACGR